MNLEDAETKKLFDTAVTAGITAATAPLKAELDKLTALVTNGQAGSAQAGKPIEGAGTVQPNEKEMSRAQFAALTFHARAQFIRAGGTLTE